MERGRDVSAPLSCAVAPVLKQPCTERFDGRLKERDQKELLVIDGSHFGDAHMPHGEIGERLIALDAAGPRSGIFRREGAELVPFRVSRHGVPGDGRARSGVAGQAA
jgi:hypothetical protein